VSYVTADPASGSVFASLNEGGGYVVVEYQWRDSQVPLRYAAWGRSPGCPQRAATVLSPTCPRAGAALVRTSSSVLCNTAVLCVFELPSLRLVCEDAPLGPRAKVYGLAGDPCGTSLVIHDGGTRAVLGRCRLCSGLLRRWSVPPPPSSGVASPAVSRL